MQVSGFTWNSKTTMTFHTFDGDKIHIHGGDASVNIKHEGSYLTYPVTYSYLDTWTVVN